MSDLSKQVPNLIKFWQLSWQRKKSLVEAFTVLSTYKILLAFLPFRYFRTTKENSVPIHEPDSKEKLETIIWAITVLGNRMPFGFTCLVQALSAKFLLRNHYDVRLQIGVSKNAEQLFAAHAWLTHNGETILGEQKNQVFEPILGWK